MPADDEVAEGAEEVARRAALKPPRHAPRWINTVAVAATVLAITGVFTWLAFNVNDRSNRSLLHLQTRQVAAALGIAVASIPSQLDDALQVAGATNSPSIFRGFAKSQWNRYGSPASRPFISESLWRRTPAGMKLLTTLGAPPRLVADGAAGAFFKSLKPKNTLSVIGLPRGAPRQLGYAATLPADRGYVVYAESPRIKPHFKVQPSSPFSELDYAVYLGAANPGNLLEASTPTPIRGQHATGTVPLGDSFLTVVATPRTQLTPGVSHSLPWIVLGVGILLALGGAAVVERLGRGRQHAEEASQEIGQLYLQQRLIAETLQHALLPERLPEIECVDLAAAYMPAAQGPEVGGDWYDVVTLPDGRLFMFVVGDVSGRGVRAAAVMASLRFASRGLILEGHRPAAVLAQLSRTLDLRTDGHFATVLCGLVDVGRRRSPSRTPATRRPSCAPTASRGRSRPRWCRRSGSRNGSPPSLVS